MEGRTNWRCDRLLMHIILGRTSARCQRALQTKEFNRLPNPRLVKEMQKNMKRGQEISSTRKCCVDTRSAEADARAAERQLTITTVRVTPSDRGLDSCLFPDSDNDDQPMEAEVAAEEAEKCNNCTCHTVKLCRDALGRGTAFCSCPSPSACLCKHIHGVCCMLSGGDATFGGLAAFGLFKEDFRLDRDPDDYYKASDGVIGVIDVEEMLLGPAAPGSGASDEDEAVGPSAAAVAADPAALATILNCIETTFAALTLTSKAQRDALGGEVIYSIRERQQRCDTTIKPAQRAGRRPPQQSAAARPTSGPLPEAKSVDTTGFWASVPIGRPATKSKEPHRTKMISVDLLAKQLSKPSPVVTAVEDAGASKKRKKDNTSPAPPASAPVVAAKYGKHF